MAKLIIEIDDEVLANAIAAAMGPAGIDSTTASDTSTDADGDDAVTYEDIAELIKEVDAKEARPILKEAGFASPAALKKKATAGDIDQDDLEDLFEALSELVEGEGEEEEEEKEEEVEINVDVVKKALQDFVEENGKEEADEILEEFEIKSVRSLKKLSEDQLEELYEALTE